MQLPRKMSAQNVMTSISRTLGNRHENKAAPSNEVKFAGEESKDKLYEPKHKQKVVRVLTVVAYVISVSLAAIILSLYYTFIWDPKDHPQYTIRQTKLNASAKALCINLTIPTSLVEPPLWNDSNAVNISSITSNVEAEGSQLLEDKLESQKRQKSNLLKILTEPTKLQETSISSSTMTLTSTSSIIPVSSQTRVEASTDASEEEKYSDDSIII